MKKRLKIVLYQKILILLTITNLFALPNIKNLLLDTVDIHKNIFDLNTLNVLSLSCPLYLISLDFDQDLNYMFYDKKNNKNIRQFTEFNYNYSNIFNITDILLTSSLILNFSSIISKDYKLRLIGYKSLLGLISMNLVKKSIKFIKWQNSLRPYNQNFRRDYGGLPSGHLMTITYLTIISLKQFGFTRSITYLLSFGYIAIDYIIRNRHYLSQLIAGVTLGSVYGFAVNSSIKCSISENLTLNYLF